MKFRIIVFIIFFLSCSESKLLVEHETWKEKRMNALFADDGYLNLAGLYSIDSGYYTMGSDETSDIKLPDIFPKNFAKIYVTDSIISFDYYDEVIYKDSIKTKKATIKIHNKAEYFSWKSFIWFVHMDSGVKAIRLRDLDHPMLLDQLIINHFPYSKKMIIEGKFEKYKEDKIRKSFNIQGEMFEEKIPGIITFSIKGHQYSLEPTLSGSGKFFVVFADKTSGNETYGGGRFLYINPSDENQNVILDFNKSYNPPCVFSSFTTCPVPTSQNTLPIKIKAGEKNYNGISFSSVYE